MSTQQATSELERDALDLLLLLDEEWIATEFAAIMTASGVTREVLLGLAPRWYAPYLDEGSERRIPSDPTVLAPRCVRVRVRSPPAR